MKIKKRTLIRKEEIIRAALQIVGRNGVGALTIASLAEAAGMSEANIYRHFPGKREIYLNLADFICASLMGKAAAIAAGSGSPATKLHKIFSFHVNAICETPGIARFVFSEQVHLGDADVTRMLSGKIGSYVDTLAGVIAAGIEEEEFGRGLAPRETALTLLGMIQFSVLRWNISGAAFDLREEAERLWRNFLLLVR